MKHNQQNKNFNFIKEPIEFNKFTNKDLLKYCLGGTLYMPGTKNFLNNYLKKKLEEMKSLVMCCEDAIDPKNIVAAEKNILFHLETFANLIKNKKLNFNDLPLIFVRVKNVEHFYLFSKKLTKQTANVLSGFVFPKFSTKNAKKYFKQLHHINKQFKTILYSMPILEGDLITFNETRLKELINLRTILDLNKKYILNIRIGGTDISSFFGVRRNISNSIYEILPVNNVISDILNVFSRADSGYIVSGTVWEYFIANSKKNIKDYIKKYNKFSLTGRKTIINNAIDGLIREIFFDKVNGIVGKTVIHPSHISFINALHAVTLEEFNDARQILNTKGGVVKSTNLNKMNESNPHRNWAKTTLFRAKAYGVIKNDRDYIKLIK